MGDRELHYIIVQIPSKGVNFSVEDNRPQHRMKVQEAQQAAAEEEQARLAKLDAEAREAPPAPPPAGLDHEHRVGSIMPAPPSSAPQPIGTVNEVPDTPLLPLDSDSSGSSGAL